MPHSPLLPRQHHHKKTDGFSSRSSARSSLNLFRIVLISFAVFSLIAIKISFTFNHSNSVNTQILNQINDNQISDIQINDNQINDNQSVQIPLVIKPGDPQKTIKNPRLQSVLNGTFHAFNGYKQFAWGFDELNPISKKGQNWFGLGLTIVDSLDTLYLMKKHDSRLNSLYDESRIWVKDNLRFDKTFIDGNNQRAQCNVFETTIRVLGSLLAIHHLSKDPIYLEKAILLGDVLIIAFETPSSIPYASIDFEFRKGILAYGFADEASSTAEVSSIQLEFKYLSHLTGDKKYWIAVEKVMKRLLEIEPQIPLVPIFISPTTGNYVGNNIRLGSRADSFYEYLYKQWFQTGMKEDIYKDMWTRSWTAVKNFLISKTPSDHFIYIGEWDSGVPKEVTSLVKEKGVNPGIEYRKKKLESLEVPYQLTPKMDHLVCFLPGTILMSVTNGTPLSKLNRTLTPIEEEDLYLAKELVSTCFAMYEINPTFLAAEIAMFRQTSVDGKKDIYTKPADRHNLLRPETIESLFYFWKITGEEKYRDWAWKIWEGFEKYSKVPSGGYTDLGDVSVTGEARIGGRDKMETFFIGETLKYLYLLFDDGDDYPLTLYVFNTEAHAFPIINS